MNIKNNHPYKIACTCCNTKVSNSSKSANKD